EREVGSLETRELRKHFAYLMDDGLKKTSVAINYRVLRAFFNWLERDGLISTSPVDGIREPKTPDKLPKVLNKDQIEKLLDTTRNWRRTWAGYRNFTMITLFLDTGLRLNECISAELDDLYNIKVIDSPAVNSEQILYLPTVQISGRIDCWTKKTAG
ncbi:hypothetical protein KGY79_09995, partial [Candidatus Bipolaricaulota bacterium]|nr:hypothetical protein [Candidatus Bipolaricaulota bacterium]